MNYQGFISLELKFSVSTEILRPVASFKKVLAASREIYMNSLLNTMSKEITRSVRSLS